MIYPGAGGGLIYRAVKPSSIVSIVGAVYFFPWKSCIRYLPSARNPIQADKSSLQLPGGRRGGVCTVLKAVSTPKPCSPASTEGGDGEEARCDGV